MSSPPPPPPPPSSTADSTKHDVLVDEAPTIAPWQDFIDIRSLSFPNSFLDIQARLNKNITHFQINYLNIVISIFYLFLGFSLGGTPFDFTFFYVTSVVCFVLYINGRSPLQVHVFGFSIVVERCLFLGLLLVIAVLPFALEKAWALLMGFLVISSSIVGLHCVLRVPSYEYEELWIDDDEKSSPSEAV